MKRNLTLSVACALGAALLLSGCGNKDYKQGVQYMQAGQYTEAIQSFDLCPDYKDADSLAAECAYRLGNLYWANGDADAARTCLQAVTSGQYATAAKAMLTEISLQETYESAQAALQEEDYQTAYDALISLGSYKDAKELLARFYYEQRVYETYTSTDRLHGTVTETIEYLYDTEGRLRQIHSTSGHPLYSFPAEILSWAYVPLMRSYATDEYFTYDESGRLISVSGLDSGSLVFLIDYVYDDQGRILQENLSECAQISRPEDVSYYSYDEEGRLSYVTFDSDFYNRAALTYNDDGTLSEYATHHLMFPVVIDYTYENGQLMQADITRAQTGMGMQPYRTDTYSYNQDGALASICRTWVEGISCTTSAVSEYTYGQVLCYSENR